MTDADPQLAAFLLAAADPPLGEGDAWLNGPRLVLADWLAERGDERAAAVQGAGVARVAAGEWRSDVPGEPAARPHYHGSPDAARRSLRRRLLGLFPGVVVRLKCLRCGSPMGWRIQLLHAIPSTSADCPECRRTGGVDVLAPDLIPPDEPEPPGQWAPGTPGARRRRCEGCRRERLCREDELFGPTPLDDASEVWTPPFLGRAWVCGPCANDQATTERLAGALRAAQT